MCGIEGRDFFAGGVFGRGGLRSGWSGDLAVWLEIIESSRADSLLKRALLFVDMLLLSCLGLYRDLLMLRNSRLPLMPLVPTGTHLQFSLSHQWYVTTGHFYDGH